MKIFCIICSFTVACIALSFAQPSASPKSKSEPHTAAASASAGPNEAIGSLVEFVPGQSVVVSTGAAQPMRFKLSAQAQYFNPKGKQVPERKLKKDRRVRVHYTKQGNDMIADRITIVRGEGGHKSRKKSQQ